MTQSLEDYLETIFLIVKEKKVARVKDVAEQMGVRKPSVINAVKELVQRGLLQHEKYGYIELTEEGQKTAKEIYAIHSLLKHFLIEILNVSEETAEKDACRIEHVISKEAISGIKNYLERSSEND